MDMQSQVTKEWVQKVVAHQVEKALDKAMQALEAHGNSEHRNDWGY
jgi:hypothetical protein